MASTRVGLLAYGSLIHPDEHRDLPGLIDAVPARVRGYRRVFHQTPSWRKGKGDQIAVLNVIPSPADTINVVCLVLETETLSALAQRERGYALEEVSLSKLSFCSEIAPSDLPETFVIYRGKEELQDNTLLPNADYLNLCLKGAEQWGEEFYSQFLESTYLTVDARRHRSPRRPSKKSSPISY